MILGRSGVEAWRPTQGEFALIDWIRRRVTDHPRVALGIGDDTAIVRFPQPADCLLTVDMLMEGVHFTFPPATPELVGRKALGVNLSDIAAMGGNALAAVVSVALPRDRAWEVGQGIHTGLQRLAEEFGVCVAGGDTNTWNGPLVVSVTVLGETLGQGPVLRSGRAAGGLDHGHREFRREPGGETFDVHPGLYEARALQENVALHSMIDVSDGLSADLHHILEESRVGAILVRDAIPVSAAAAAITDGDRSPLERALGDGEDFELLFTLSPGDGERLLASPPFSTPLTQIGRIVPGSGCQLEDDEGGLTPLAPAGWQHPL